MAVQGGQWPVGRCGGHEGGRGESVSATPALCLARPGRGPGLQRGKNRGEGRGVQRGAARGALYTVHCTAPHRAPQAGSRKLRPVQLAALPRPGGPHTAHWSNCRDKAPQRRHKLGVTWPTRRLQQSAHTKQQNVSDETQLQIHPPYPRSPRRPCPAVCRAAAWPRVSRPVAPRPRPRSL